MIRLLLVDDQALIRDGIKTMLNLEPDLEVVGIAGNGEAAIEQVKLLQPDVVLMDVSMPIMSGKAATRIIHQQFPTVKVLVLSTYDDDHHVAEAMRAGAKGYLLKDMPVEDLAAAIRFVNRGYTQLAPGLFEQAFTATPNPASGCQAKTQTVFTQVPPRERDVLRLIGTGATNREIAQQLYLTEGTVKGYITSILNRLGLKNRAQLAIYANAVVWNQDQAT